jgi:hypothetical protein
MCTSLTSITPSSMALSPRWSTALSPLASLTLLTLNWCVGSYLVSLGFVEVKSDTSLFIYRRSADAAYLLLYVDDIILTALSPELFQRTTSALQ